MANSGGRPRTPTTQLKLHGTYRADRRYENEPTSDSAVPPRPKFLKGEARREWDRITPILLKMRCISEADMAMIAAYCLEWGRYVALAKKVSRVEDMVCVTANGNEILSPFYIAQIAALKNFQKLASEFGLSPSARTRIKTEPKPDEVNPFAKMLRNRNVG